MKIASIAIAVVLLALSVLVLSPVSVGFRANLAVIGLLASVLLLVAIVVGWKERPVAAARLEPTSVAPARPVPTAPPPPSAAAAPVAGKQAEAEVVGFLAALQAKGRLVDFLMDDLTNYSDAQVGAVARVVHDGCRAVLREQFHISPVREETEGSTVTVAAGYPADEYRLVGKISGQAPFSGTLMHRGWKTDSVKLPRLLPADGNQLPTIAPAEVELK